MHAVVRYLWAWSEFDPSDSGHDSGRGWDDDEHDEADGVACGSCVEMDAPVQEEIVAVASARKRSNSWRLALTCLPFSMRL
jgi:hypothetical protein